MRTIEQVVSRHHPAFAVPALRLGLGQDDNVYLVIGHQPRGHALRLAADGSEQRFGRVGYAAWAITADPAGVIATAETHFPHRIDFWDKEFNPLGSIDDFTADGTHGYFAPSAVEAARSGWFYAIDQHRGQVVRLRPGVVDRRVTLTGLDANATSKTGPVGMRVAEELGMLYTAWPTSAGAGLVCASKLDGTHVWTIGARPAGDAFGGYDVDDDGRLHVSAGLPREPARRQVTVYDPRGRREREVTLALPDDPYTVQYLRVRGQHYYVKRNDPTYLFEVYDRTGALVRRVGADVERLSVTYESDEWTAGRKTPLTITHDRGRWPGEPRFRVWLRPLGVPEFTELPLTGGAVTPPADARGLYHLRVSPDVAGRLGDYTVDGFVEIRTPESSKGSLSLMTCRVLVDENGVEMFTALNRFSYGRGEPVTVRVVARVADGTPLPGSARVRLLRDGAEVHAETVTLSPDGTGRLELTGEYTGTLTPGRYLIDAERPPGFTVAPLHLDLGPGLVRRPDFHITWYSDIYANNHASVPSDPRDVVKNPSTQLLPIFADLPDTVEAHVARAEKLGLNLFVDRLGVNWPASFKDAAADAGIVERLKRSKTAVHWDKAMFEDPARRTVAGYGARGMEEQAVLYANDTYLPLGLPGNNEIRKQGELESDLLSVIESLRTYAAFRGWTWGANWWVTTLGAAAAESEDERRKYDEALKHVEEPGGWAPVLDTVTDRSIALRPIAADRFREVLNRRLPGKVGAMTGPYRAPQTPPPVVFAPADEVDLHYQGEQLQLMGATAHMVDYYRRPGKPAWGHPELFNDDGTGGMILPTLLQQVMRGANGTGMTGDQGAYHLQGIADRDERGAGSGGRPGDPRSGDAGRTSVLRAAFDLCARLGPPTAGARNADRVAIVVSTRMQRLETSQGLSSRYFMRLFEAYTACLYAHRPATFVFTEDVSADVLRGYDAVLLIGQRVDLDPRLATALSEVSREPEAVPVFADDSCVQRYKDAYRPLGTAFTRVESDETPQSDDDSYRRFRRIFLDQAAKVTAVLKDVVAPVAECDNPEVLLSERKAGSTTYIWAVNNTLLDWEPGLVWRVGLRCGHRVPVTARLKVALPALHQVVDVLTGERVSLLGGEFTADLRTVPARLYAVVPLAHDPLPPPAEYAFGPHVRDIAVAADGRTAALTAFDWDHNLYGLDLATGTTRWRRRLGHHFAYTPSALGAGFAAQGFDVHSPEGYHLYLLDAEGSPRRRFALFGLPKKATDWMKGGWGHDYGLNNFAAAPGGSWIATSGDLGLALWDTPDGGGAEPRERWAHEWWKTGERTPLRLLALDDDTLVTFAANTITGLAAADGSTLWTIPTAEGRFGGGVVSGDRRTAVIWSDADGGRVYVIRGGILVNTLPTAADEVSVSADGSFLAVAFRNQLRAYDAGSGLLWTYTGDDLLRRPRVSPDGTRVAVGSELGTLAVLRRDGTPLAAKDLQALPVPAWLPDGGLLVATWTGTVLRYTAALDERWRTRLAPSETDIRPKLLAPDPVPVVRRAGWGNTTEPKALTPNLIKTTSALLDVRLVSPVRYVDLGKQNAVALLTDGRADPPAEPWVPWSVIGAIRIQEGQELLFTVDTFRTQVRLTGVTFAEDPAHPESWLRDVQLQWWDTKAGIWKDGPKLLSDAGAVHTHTFEALSSSRFRLRTTGGGGWPVGNIRLGELVFHGSVVGNSHRDVLEGNALAVLFDDREDDVRDIVEDSASADIQLGGAAVGTGCLRLKRAVQRFPTFRAPFGHAMHDWDFRIVENPSGPGQYRYLQFAWKALSLRTTGISVRFGPATSAPVFSVSVGDSHWPPETVMVERRLAGPVPADWTVVRVDLWKVTAGAVKVVDQLALRSNGDGALFDQIVLARTQADLPNPPLPRVDVTAVGPGAGSSLSLGGPAAAGVRQGGSR
ncbi:WD40 repeat domain-containing protein [Streptomyces sp. URMC 126]|uniref:WD40 repeat domain-containing protein n=1 Tax=Streptomyces sp. URMC 126 TaxID=3423401 RepID=UPI003F19FE6F